MPDPNRLIRAKDILAAPEVRRLCGISPTDRHTLRRWRASRGFPEPIRVLKRKKGQHLELWARPDVKAWLDANPPVSNLIEPEESP
jgi:predicted DNA-binding transcriptional regulator AlpA